MERFRAAAHIDREHVIQQRRAAIRDRLHLALHHAPRDRTCALRGRTAPIMDCRRRPDPLVSAVRAARFAGERERPDQRPVGIRGRDERGDTVSMRSRLEGTAPAVVSGLEKSGRKIRRRPAGCAERLLSIDSHRAVSGRSYLWQFSC